MESVPETMPALSAMTLRQPWAWAVAHADCSLINQSWRPPPYIANQVIAIHASKRWTRTEQLEASALACQLHPEVQVPLGSEDYALGHIVALARVIGFVDCDVHPERGPYTFDTKTSKGYVCVGGRFSTSQIESVVQDQWFRGPCAWLLDDVRTVATPVEARGYQKLWRVPGPQVLALATQVSVY